MSAPATEDDRAVDLAAAALRSGSGVWLLGRSALGIEPVLNRAVRELDAPGRARVRLLREPYDVADAVGAVDLGTWLLVGGSVAEAAVPDVVRTMIRAGALQLIRVPPLSPSRVLALVRRTAAERLDEDALARLVPSRGTRDIDLLLAAVEDTAEADPDRPEGAGTSERRRPGARAGVDRRLRERALASVLGAADDPAEVEWALDLLSLVPELDIARAERILRELEVKAPARTLEALEERDAIEVLRSGRGENVVVADGATEVVMPRTLGSLRRKRLWSLIEPILAAAPLEELERGELIAIGGHALDAGIALDPRVLTGAARASLRRSDRMLSMRLAAAAVEAGAGVDAELVLAAAEIRAGSTEAAHRRLEGILPRADDDLQRSGAVVALMQLAFERRGHRADADRVTDSDPVTDARAAVLQGFLLNALGDVTGGAGLVRLGLDAVRGRELAHAHYVLGTAELMAGRFTSAREELDVAERLLRAGGEDVSRIVPLRADLDFYEGRSQESAVAVRRYMASDEVFHDPSALGMAGWALAWQLLLTESVSDAVDEFVRAVENLEKAGITRFALVVRADLATALAIAGRAEESELALLDAVWAEGRAETPLTLLPPKLEQARGWLAAVRGDLGAAAAHFIAASELCERDDLRIGALVSLLDAARVGSARAVNGRVGEIAKGMEGPFASFASGYAGALVVLEEAASGAAADAERRRRSAALALDAAGESARSMGLALFAAEAYAREAQLLESLGEDRDAAGARRRRDEQMRISGLDRLILVPERRVRPLSSREAEIADLAAVGMSNREISQQLVVSIRTVETHLLRVYVKLGIRRRSELAEALIGAPRASVEDA